MRIIIVFVAILIASLASNSGALAHAMLSQSVPAVGSTVPTPPNKIVLSFTESLEPAFSGIEVRDAAGQRVDSGKAAAGASKNQLQVPLKRLAPGSYSVSWHVLSVDTHKTEGNFKFTVGP
jgi:methionine-rich copper-binding protein CopC